MNKGMEEFHRKPVEKLVETHVPVATTHQSIRHVEKLLLEHEAAYAAIDYIYIVDSRRKLKGVLSIKDLFRLPKGMAIEEAMTTNVIAVHPHSHREHVARLALKHSLKAIPVVDKEGHFIGAVPAHTVLKIVNEELSEDVYKFAGIESHEYTSISVLRSTPVHMLQMRLPWLLFGLFGGLLAAQVVGVFEELLQAEIALVGFMPLIVYISDAVGGQSQTIFIRSLAMEGKLPFVRYFIREMITAAGIGVILSVILFGFTSMTGITPRVGAVIAVSLFLTVIISITTALSIPAVLHRTGRDPAIASGPFATIIRDVSSILVYFGIAQILLLSLA